MITAKILLCLMDFLKSELLQNQFYPMNKDSGTYESSDTVKFLYQLEIQ